MNKIIFQRMTAVFRDVLDAPDLVLTRDLDATQVPNWDSLNHISLIIALEEEFALEFSTEDLVSLANVGEMCDMIEKRLTNNDA